MRTSKLLNLTLIIGLTVQLTFGQAPQIPTIQIPTVPQPTHFTPQSIFDLPKPHSPTNPMDIFQGTDEQERIRRQNEQLIREAEKYEHQRLETQKQLYADLKMERTNFGLPSKNHIAGTEYYRKAFDKLSGMNPDDFSVKEATFIIENAFYEEQKSYEEFDKIVKQTGNFLRKKMDELGDRKSTRLNSSHV